MRNKENEGGILDIKITEEVPQLIYDIYAAAAKELKGYTTEQVMSAALQAYAQYLFEEMRANGELTQDNHTITYRRYKGICPSHTRKAQKFFCTPFIKISPA